jgi:hypothetical protein
LTLQPPDSEVPESSLGPHDDDESGSTRPGLSARRLMSLPAFVIPASFALAALAGYTAHRLAPSNVADLAALCAAWVAFYPIPRLKPRIPWWNHWLQGIFILLGFWLVTRSSR